MVVERPNGNGFATRALIILAGVILSALMGFFVWLALAVVEIRVGVAEMKMNIADLQNERAQQAIAPPIPQPDPATAANRRRIEDLEQRAARPAPAGGYR